MNEPDEEYYEYFNSNEFEIDTDNILTSWIDKIHEQIFRTNNTSITFDRKVKMLYRWYERAEYREVEPYFNNNSEYFADILYIMFSSNIVIR